MEQVLNGVESICSREIVCYYGIIWSKETRERYIIVYNADSFFI